MKYVIILISLFFSIGGFAKTASDEKVVERDSLVHFAKQYIGTPYLWGGQSEKGFDCSGFVYFVYSHFGVKVARTSRGFKDKGHEVDITRSCPGDIILFTGTNAAQRTIGHVGIILKNVNGTIDFIHSSSSKKHYGVTITRYNESGYVKRFLKVINILNS
ncbi:MAG: C40 family peptidase [Crocinitomicaceae bacterium]